MPRFVLPRSEETFTGPDAKLRKACADFGALDFALRCSNTGARELPEPALNRTRDAWWKALAFIERAKPKTAEGRLATAVAGSHALRDWIESEHGKSWRTDADPRSRVALAALMEVVCAAF